MPSFDLISDNYFDEHLNPLFLQSIREFWTILATAPEVSQEEILKAQCNLLRFVFRRLFQSIYLHQKPLNSGKIFFLSCIHGDGIGDYFALLKSAKIFIQSHPTLEVNVVYRHQQQLPEVDLSDYLLTEEKIHAFHELTDYQILEGVLEGKEHLLFEEKLNVLQLQQQELIKQAEKTTSPSILGELLDKCALQIAHLEELQVLKKQALPLYEEIKSSVALVHIALAINTFENPLLGKKSFYFAETGNFQGVANLLEHNWFGMGLNPLEEGIFLHKSFRKNTTWRDGRLAKLLWQSEHPTAIQQADYQKKHSLHLGYMTRITVQHVIFIYLVVLYHKSDMRDIDILLPKLKQEDIDGLDLLWLASQGISQVILVDFDYDNNEHILCNTGLSGGKSLRLIHEFPLPASDFERMLDLSEEIVGCTGDLSLSECLTAGKVPFYELRQHKLEIWHALEIVAKHLCLQDVLAYFLTVEKYKEDLPHLVAEQLYAILQHENFKEEWQKLLKFIHKYYCFEDALKTHLNRFLLISEHPEIKDYEEELLKRYVAQDLTAKEVVKALSDRLKNSIENASLNEPRQ